MDEHQSQLRQVEEALKLVTNPSEVQSLRSLRADLIELIELTRQTTNSNNENENKSIQSDKVNDEIQLFMSEINQVNTVNTSQVKDEKETEEDLMKELRAMIGHKCSAPHNHSWGNVTYHNAIICGIEEPTYVPINSNEIRMRILFTNPTHREMIPCSYFLEGECRFESDKCHFSHGELVRFTELKEYKEPEFEKLARNCIVLAKMKDRIWHKGRVLCANFEEKNCRVRLENQKKEIDFPFEDLFPIFHDEDLSDEFSSSNSTSDSEAVNEFEEARCARLVEQSLFSYAPTQALGEWEKHTKGIGSKLMAKMGYIQGTGLGSDGRGIITPITAQILPQGKSLDHCMELREAANGDQNLFSVEKKIKREQKKQETLSAKAYQRECKKVDVFSFLNTTILTNPNKKKQLSNEISSKSETRNLLKNQSTKNLNVESVRIADDIRKKEKEILKMKESMGRHTRGSEVHKRLQVQLMEKYQELGSLKKTESSLAKEQASRKTKNKLCVF